MFENQLIDQIKSTPHHSGNLLATKLEIPLVGTRIVSRRRLTERLSTGLKKRLTLLVAPTGYGKTTLIVEWVSSLMLPDQRVIWLSVDPYDNDPYRFWSYIATAVKKIYPRLRYNPQELFHNQSNSLSLQSLTTLFNAITQVPYQLVLILDDYQNITNGNVHAHIHYFLEYQPKNLHFLISSRESPPFPLSRLRAQRQLNELEAKDLSFTMEETQQLFSSSMELEIDHDQVTSLVLATEGWIAGLQLLSLSLKNQHDRNSFIANLPQENYQIFEYLTEEVLDHQTPKLRDFLLKTSILSEFCAPLCNAILEQNDSQEMLSRIQQANLFISPRDEHHYWYSYHRLFADTLQKYLKNTFPDLIPELHRKASIWFQQNGYSERAVSHSLAVKDIEQAARIIDDCGLHAVVNFDLPKLTQCISLFSKDMIQARPQVGICWALANFLIKRFDQVEPILQLIEQAYQNPERKSDPEKQSPLIDWQLAAMRTCLHHWLKDSDQNASDFTKLILEAPANDRYLRGFMFHNRAEIYALQGKINTAIDSYAQGAQFAIDYGLIREYCYSQVELAYLRKIQGCLQEATQDNEELLTYVLQSGLSEDLIAVAKTGLAEIALEQNRTDQAHELMQWVIDHYYLIESSPPNWVRREWVFLRLAKYYLNHKDFKQAHQFFQKTLEGFRHNHQVVPYLSSQIIDLQVRLWAANGDLTSRKLNFEKEINRLPREGKFEYAKITAKIRYLLAQKQFEKALDLINEIIPQLKDYLMNERLIEVLILQSLAFHHHKQPQQAIQALHQALQLAEPEDYRKLFTDEGILMKTLLEFYLQQVSQTDPLPKKLAENLIPEINLRTVSSLNIETHIQTTKELVTPIPEPLSERELELATLITKGKSTKEIALEMMISINTTKTHIKNIYRKMDVHTRLALSKRLIALGIVENIHPHPQKKNKKKH